MTNLRRASWPVSHGVAIGTLVLTAACATHQPNQNPSTGNGGYTAPTTTQDANGDVRNERRDDAGRYAHKQPPQNPPETPGPQPGPQSLWVPGHYSWDGNDFQWQAGGWAVPPTGFHAWVPGHWDQVSSGNWSYTEGRWQ